MKFTVCSLHLSSMTGPLLLISLSLVQNQARDNYTTDNSKKKIKRTISRLGIESFLPFTRVSFQALVDYEDVKGDQFFFFRRLSHLYIILIAQQLRLNLSILLVSIDQHFLLFSDVISNKYIRDGLQSHPIIMFSFLKNITQ